MASQQPQGLQVAGCADKSIGPIVNGQFVPNGQNHSRPVYKKTTQANGVDVQIYFWDERDGADFSGWWFGPKVGGDQVWAYNPEKAAVPPSGGWRVPFGGPVDAQFVVSPAAQQPLGQQAPNMQPPNMQPPSMQPPSMQPPSMPRQPGPSGAQGQQAQGGVVQAAQGQLQQLLSFLPQHQQVLSQQQMQLVREACQTQPQQVQQLLGSLLQEQRHAQAQMQQAQMGVQAQMQQMQAMGNVAGVHHLQQTFAMQTAQLQQQHMALQQRHMQQLGQLASNQQASVAAKKQKMEETRQKLEEQRRQMQEQAKKRQEELAAKLAEEKLRRETEMKRRIVEQRVQLSIRRILVKLRAATPDTYDAAEKELEDLLQQELEQNCYVPSDQVKQEIEVVREKQRQRIEQLRVQQEAARKRREEQQKKHDDLKLRAEELVKELDGYVAQAESASKHLDDVLAPLEGNGEMNCDEIEEMGKGVAAAEVQARTAFNVCNDFMVKHNAEMRVPPAQAASPGPMRPPGEAAPPDTGPATQQLLADLVGRINACREKQLAAASSVPQARERAKRKAAALQLNTELQAVLSRYDSDGDGALSRKDVQKLAKQEFGFDLPDAVLSKIFRTDVESPIVRDGSKGVQLEGLPLVRAHIGAARELDRDTKRRKLRLEREAAFQKVVGKLAEKVKQLDVVIKGAERGIAAAEARVNPLPTQSRKRPAAEVEALAEESEGPIGEAAEGLAAARRQWDGVLDGFDEKIAADLKSFLRKDFVAKRCAMTVGKLDARQSRLVQIVKNTRLQAKKKSDVELRKLKGAAVKVLCHVRRSKKLRPEQLFDLMDGNSDDQLDEKEFVAFFKTADTDVKTLEVVITTKEVPIEDEPAPVAEASAEVAATPEGPTASEGAPPASEAAPEASSEAVPDAEKPAGDSPADAAPTGGTPGEGTPGDGTSADDVATEGAPAEGCGSGEMAPAAPKGEIVVHDPEAARQLDEELKKFAANGRAPPAARKFRTVQEAKVVERGETVELPPAELPRLFQHILEEGSAAISREALARLVQVCYTVLRPPGEGSGWEGRPPLVGEVVEVLQGPEMDSTTGELRVQAKSLVDDAEGWLTVVGSDGSAFLKEGGRRLRTLRAAPLTGSLAPGGEVLRNLYAGELLSVEEWPTRDEASGSMRAKVRTLMFGAAEGFVTTCDDTGAWLAEGVA